MKLNMLYLERCCSLIRAIFLFCFLGGGAIAQTFEPDHYASYEIKSIPFFPQQISLQDKLIGWTDFSVVNAEKLLNPAEKFHKRNKYPIKNNELHYTAFNLRAQQSVQITKKLHVINQFGEFDLDKFKPDHLLVPSYKVDFLPFALQVYGADHYLCYDIEPQNIPAQQGNITDQFRGRNFSTVKATRFCTPVAKRHDGREYGIGDMSETNHLMCFEIQKRRIAKIVALLNQFGIQQAIAIQGDELCIPSRAIEIPQLCHDTVLGQDGICNGICLNALDTCTPTSDGGCACVPPPPPRCGNSGPDDNGECNGLCDNPADSCLPIRDSECGCVTLPPPPILCGELSPDNGVCNGLCENPRDICQPSNDGATCGCVTPPPPPILCGDTDPDNGICNGLCENPNETCQSHKDGTECACAALPPPAFCLDADPDNGVCNGLCATPGESCQTSEDGTTCECLPPVNIPTCGLIGEEECAGTCADGILQCVFNPNTANCECA